ncbi:fimbrin-like protein 2-like [Planoprotostelium fungivorum]|uniref:Fimbrin-like protein 2-like n=1 Tax=Planoprotostelium fungivorum TaxID=1890364 RepID=A0A2P6NSI9_9EUKA|nr:fimbrin-like protein 2-like [Planoprotostelium fungivorum]
MFNWKTPLTIVFRLYESFSEEPSFTSYSLVNNTHHTCTRYETQMSTTENKPSLLETIGEKILDAKETVVAAATGAAPLDRHAPAAPEAPTPAETVAPIPEGQQLGQAVASANDKLQNRPTFIPPAEPEHQQMMDLIHNLGVRDLGRDLFYYRQFFTEEEIAEYWKEFEHDQEARVTVGDLLRAGGRRPAFEEVRTALSNRETDQTLSFGQFLGLLKESRGLDKNREKLLQRETVLSEGSGVHGNSMEERQVLIHFVNLLLERDETVSGILPLDEKSPVVFNEFTDGGLFCKLLNRIQPGTIDEDKAFHFGEGLHFLQLMDNQVMSLKAAKSLGANVDSIDPEGLLRGDPRHILSFLEQLFKLTFGCGSRQYNEEESDRISKGLLGAPTEPGFFVPAESAPAVPKVTEADLYAAERAAPVNGPMHSELEAARLNAQKYSALVAHLESQMGQPTLSREVPLTSQITQQPQMQQPQMQQPEVQQPQMQRPQMQQQMPQQMRSFNPALGMFQQQPSYNNPLAQRSTPYYNVLSSLSPRTQRRAVNPAPAPYAQFQNQTPVSSSAYSTPMVSATPAMVSATPAMVSATPAMVPATPSLVSATPAMIPATPALGGATTGTGIVPRRAGEALVKGILRWKKRYIALDGQWLHLYKNSGNNSGKHSIDLSGATVTQDIEASKPHSIFVNNARQQEKAHISFGSEILMQDWMRDLNDAKTYIQQNAASRTITMTQPVHNSAMQSQPIYNTMQSQPIYNNTMQSQPIYNNTMQSQPIYNNAANQRVIRPQTYGTYSTQQMSGSSQTGPFGQLNHGPVGPSQPTTFYSGSGVVRTTYTDTPMGAPKVDFSNPETLREFGLQHLIRPTPNPLPNSANTL